MSNPSVPPPSPPATPFGGGNGGSASDVNARLVRLEEIVQHLATKADVAELRSDIRNLEKHIATNIATKEDIQKLKVWILAGVLGGVVALTIFVLAVFRAVTSFVS